ncbi:Glycosyl transferase family 8 [Lachnospiraceae bacterium YSD2013]|nr:Glycosyl transferase family 8 [Lachnospiraceae bacterium YSD2013]
MKRAYITILTSDDFEPGVSALYKRIREYSREDFCVLVSDDVSSSVKDKLSLLGAIVVDEKNSCYLSDCLTDIQKNDRWAKTLFKLQVFRNRGYDKLVYLDSDLLIRASLDDLFEKPSFSAVSDKDFFPQYSRGGLNAGVMVIEPSNSVYEGLIKEVSKVAATGKPFGDQDVINSYLDKWDELTNLHLDVSYNTCFYDSEDVKDPKVVHFILGNKPWMSNAVVNYLKCLKWYMTRKGLQAKYMLEYLKILRG